MPPLDEPASRPPPGPVSRLVRAVALGRTLLRTWVDLPRQRVRCPVCTSAHLLPMAVLARPCLLHCRRCQLIFDVAPREDASPSPSRLAPRLDREPWERGEAEGCEAALASEGRVLDLLELGREEERLGAGRRSLEVGCGAGQGLELLRRRGWLAEGLESDARLLARAGGAGPEADRGVHRGALDPPSLASGLLGRYDLLVMRGLLDRVPDPLRTVSTFRAGLREGGLLLVEVPLSLALEDRAPLFFFSAASLLHLLGRAGLAVRSHALRPAAAGGGDGLVVLAKALSSSAG
jgi:SAM-dependent methyltransferase